MYPTYVRGLAYLKMHNGDQAAREFQKIIDHRGLVTNSFVEALARLQLGRAYGLTVDVEKADAAYAAFLVSWLNADPDIPVLRRATVEYAQLKTKQGGR
jgi:eukaryotic-like serine/threonine-protein kinase